MDTTRRVDEPPGVSGQTGSVKAIVQDEYGDSSVLRLEDVAIPEPADDEVLIEVHAAGVDRATWHRMTGRPYAARAVHGPRRPYVRTPGTDLAGRVVGLGRTVTAFGFGALVFGAGRATFAEYAVARPDRLRVLPGALSFVPAAALPTPGAVALRALAPGGRRVLVAGAAGAAGTLAVMLAVRSGATVTGVCRAGQADLVRGLGAAVIEAGEPLTGTYDLIVDLAGSDGLRALGRHLAPDGSLMVGPGSGPDRQLRAALLNPFTRQRLQPVPGTVTAAELDRLAGLTPVVDRTVPLADAAAAVDRVASGDARGAVVLTVH
jgi:NADPH:quinone reductase-like Zn-dependent oxidoreductase